MKLTLDQERAEASANPTPTVFEAIVRKQCLVATYNRVEMILAPHVIYTRHGDLFVDAIALERDGKVPKEMKVGTFKLAGLNDVRLTSRAFFTSGLFQPGDPKYGDSALMMVEPG